MEKEMTKKKIYERLIEIVKEAKTADKEILIKRLEKDIELLDKKKSVQSKTQKENERLIEIVYKAIADMETPTTATALYEKVRDVEGITSFNKVSALITQLKKEGRVIRVEDKKRAYFSINKENLMVD